MIDRIKKNTERAKMIILWIKIYFIFSCIDIILQIYQYNIWGKYNFESWLYDYDVMIEVPQDVQKLDMIYSVYLLCYLIPTVFCAIYFIQWFRRAYCNLNRVGVSTRLKEGWASGSWFVPIYSLFAPYQIMKEISVKTQTYYKEKATESNLIGLWWMLWIVANLTTNFSDGIFTNIFEGDLQSQWIAMFISSLLWLVLCPITIKMINQMSSHEDCMYERSVGEELISE